MGETRALIVAGLLVVLAVVAVAPLFTRGGGSRVAAAVGLVAIGGVWLMVNAPVEGEVLVTLAYERGITEADLPSVLAFVLALVVLVVPRRR